MLSSNPNAIQLLQQNQDKIDWFWLCSNPNAVHILEQNQDKINWYWVCYNEKACHLIDQKLQNDSNIKPYINWNTLSSNPNAIDLLKKNIYKINRFSFSTNPSIFVLDCMAMKEQCKALAKDLAEYVFHPQRIIRFCKKYNIQFDELLEIY